MGKFDIKAALAAAGANAEDITKVEALCGAPHGYEEIPISFRDKWRVIAMCDLVHKGLILIGVKQGNGCSSAIRLLYDPGTGLLTPEDKLTRQPTDWTVDPADILNDFLTHKGKFRSHSYNLLVRMLAHMDELAQPVAA